MSTHSERITGELDAVALGALLQQDVEEALGESSDKPTITLERDRLLGLLEESSGPKELAHTVPRASRQAAKQVVVPPHEIIDTDISPTVSPAVLYGVLAMLIGLFFAVMQAS